MVAGWVAARTGHSGLHGHRHHRKQRLVALILIGTGIARTCAWLTLIALYLAGVAFTKTLFQSVAFVAVISLYANAATDFGQACASLAQLTAGDAHQDVEHTRAALQVNIGQVDADIGRLAALSPGVEAQQLAAAIRERLVTAPRMPA